MTGSRQEMWSRWNGRRVLRVGFAVVAAFVLLPYLLVVIYRFVDPPVSTLMLARYVTLQTVTRQWTPYDELSRNLINSVLMSEDARFCVHSGVDFDALRSVVESLDDEDAQTRGASTIAMQTAKNLFLWPGQNYLRKALEIPLALWIDFVWPKRRIVEVYLNIAEWGDGIFGAAAATELHFGEGPSRLTPRQAALLAASLPNPHGRKNFARWPTGCGRPASMMWSARST